MLNSKSPIPKPIRVSFEYFDNTHVSWEPLSRDYWTEEEFDNFILTRMVDDLHIDPHHYCSLPWLERVAYVLVRVREDNDARLMALHESREHVKQ